MGYLYQCRFALLSLLDGKPSEAISIEKFDDVAFDIDGEPTQLIQTKHHLVGTGSLSNASRDMWSTIGRWVRSVLSGSTQMDEVRFVIVTTGTAPTESAASFLRPGMFGPRNPEAARSILEDVARQSESQSNRKSYEAFLEMAEPSRRRLLERIDVLDGSPSIVDVKHEILDRLRLFCRDKHIEPFFERLEGWWTDQVISHLAGGSHDPLRFGDLRKRITDLRDQFSDESLPIDFFDAIAPHEDELSSDQRVFIQQLRLVAVGNNRIQTAISDYYRAYQQRSKWIREDLLLVGELESYETRLVDEWSRLFDIMVEDLPPSADDEVKMREGRALYNTIQRRSEKPIRKNVDEPYVQRGTQQILSNRMEIGWHPEFMKRLQGLLYAPPEVKR